MSIKKWDAGEKNGEIDQFLAELVFWLSCKISFFTISNHTNGAAELFPNKKSTSVDESSAKVLSKLGGFKFRKEETERTGRGLNLTQW